MSKSKLGSSTTGGELNSTTGGDQFNRFEVGISTPADDMGTPGFEVGISTPTVGIGSPETAPGGSGSSGDAFASGGTPSGWEDVYIPEIAERENDDPKYANGGGSTPTSANPLSLRIA